MPRGVYVRSGRPLPPAPYRESARRRGRVGNSLILRAALALAAYRPGGVFTEWELSVAAWRLDPHRFGMAGFESHHPDHKRVYSHVLKMPKLIERCGVNRYRLTGEGRAEAESL